MGPSRHAVPSLASTRPQQRRPTDAPGSEAQRRPTRSTSITAVDGVHQVRPIRPRSIPSAPCAESGSVGDSFTNAAARSPRRGGEDRDSASVRRRPPSRRLHVAPRQLESISAHRLERATVRALVTAENSSTATPLCSQLRTWSERASQGRWSARRTHPDARPTALIIPPPIPRPRCWPRAAAGLTAFVTNPRALQIATSASSGPYPAVPAASTMGFWNVRPPPDLERGAARLHCRDTPPEGFTVFVAPGARTAELFENSIRDRADGSSMDSVRHVRRLDAFVPKPISTSTACMNAVTRTRNPPLHPRLVRIVTRPMRRDQLGRSLIRAGARSAPCRAG